MIPQILNNLTITKGDITQIDIDCIVNAANSSLLGGGGVDGAIHRAAGPDLLHECRQIGGCKHGEARITKGYNLKAQYIIHTPGPVYRGGNANEKKILCNSYWNSLLLAKQYKLKSIAFPAISTGIYGYPKSEACHIAIDSTIDFMRNNDYLLTVTFVLFDNENYTFYKNYLGRLHSEN